jgi:hypothetical protein
MVTGCKFSSVEFPNRGFTKSSEEPNIVAALHKESVTTGMRICVAFAKSGGKWLSSSVVGRDDDVPI